MSDPSITPITASVPSLAIKTVGHSGLSVPSDYLRKPEWRERLTEVVFPKVPRAFARGSRIIYYGAGTRRFFAVLEVLDDEPQENVGKGHDRWPWLLNVRPIVAIPVDEHAPTIEDVGINPLSLRRQSHIKIDAEQYERIAGAIVDAARRGVALPGADGDALAA